MLKSTLAKGFAALFLGLVVTLVPTRQADAAVFVGTFDPSFGGNLDDLGFRGQATFFIPDACLGLTGFLLSNDSGCSNGAMSLTAATVELYRFSLNPLDPTPTLASVAFAPPSQALIDVLLGVDPTSGQTTLQGVNSPVVGPQSVNVFDSVGTIYAGPLWLEFHQPDPNTIFSTFSAGAFDPAGAYLFACNPDVTSSCAQIQSNPAQITFSRVSEPATPALVLAALAAVFGLRRRRL